MENRLLGNMEMGKIEVEETQYTYLACFAKFQHVHLGQIVLTAEQEMFFSYGELTPQGRGHTAL